MELPIVSAKVDTTEIEKALQISNAVIDNLKNIKALLSELSEVAAEAELKLDFNGVQEDV